MAGEQGKFSSLFLNLPALPAENASSRRNAGAGAVSCLHPRGEASRRGRSEAPRCSGLRADLGFGVPEDFLLLIASQFCDTPSVANFSGWLLITSSGFIAFLHPHLSGNPFLF